MDRQFLEFWGNFLLSVARGQRQMEDLERWLQRDSGGFDDLTALFRKAYGLEESGSDNQVPEATGAWKQSEEAFRATFQEYLRAFGVVSLEQHQALVEENERLQGKIAEQEKTIARLQLLLGEKGLLDPDELARKLQGIMENQANAFQKIMAHWQSDPPD